MSDPRITRLVHTEGTNRTVELEDGSVVIRSGGSVSWRNNNPGNLKFEFAGSADRTVKNPRSREDALDAAQARYQGVVDLDQWGNAIFESYEAGRAAKIQLLERRFSDQSVEQFLPQYSRADYSGSTNHRAQAAAIFAEGDRQGVDLRGKTVGSMTTQEREALADGIRLFEGWRAGEVSVVTPPSQTQSTTLGQTAPSQPGANPRAVGHNTPGNFNDVMRVMLPAQNGVSPHMTSDYGQRTLNGQPDHHGGVDFNYVGGQNGINMRHPTVRSPVSGEVVYGDGQGTYGTVKIRDDQGNLHEILHLDSRSVRVTNPPTHVNAGDPIGTMGGRGPKGESQYAQHVHYQIKDASGQTIDPERFWNGRTVEGQSHGGTGAATVSGAMADGVLRQRDRGPEVTALQETLNRLGYTGRDGQPLETRSGVYGPNTHYAVEEFQRRHGLKDVDGIVGGQTRDALTAAATRPLMSEATHPNHRLYGEIARQLPPGTCPEAAANITLQAMENGVTSVDKLSRVDVRGSEVFVTGTTPGDRVKVDMQAPTPTMQQMSDHTRDQSQEAARTQEQSEQQAREAHTRVAFA